MDSSATVDENAIPAIPTRGDGARGGDRARRRIGSCSRRDITDRLARGRFGLPGRRVVAVGGHTRGSHFKCGVVVRGGFLFRAWRDARVCGRAARGDERMVSDEYGP